MRPRVRRPRRPARPAGVAADRWLRMGSWGALVSALAAALGLLFSGMVALSSVNAIRQQLEQDRRYQAGRVTSWYTQPEAGYGLVVVNRSLDPVTALVLVFEVRKLDGDRVDDRRVPLGFGTLTPCTRLTFPPGSFHTAISRFSDFSQEYLDADATPVAIRFTDANGRRWVRDDTGLHVMSRSGPAEMVPYVTTPEIGVPDVKREPAQHCDV